jgi:hypothetical protein
MAKTENDSMDRIRAEIAAGRKRRPSGWAQRCELCRFWEADRVKEGFESEDQEGECHRHAPHIVHHHSAEALGRIAWAVEETANIKHDKYFDYAFEGVKSTYYDWPRTTAQDWCGDFLERKT